MLGSQLAAKTHQIQSQGSKNFLGGGGMHQTPLEGHNSHNVCFTHIHVCLLSPKSPSPKRKILYETHVRTYTLDCTANDQHTL